MINELAILGLALIYASLFAWAFRALPREDWQFVASVPRRKDPGGGWAGTNLTYYGVFTAGGVAVGLAAAAVLMGSLYVPIAVIWIVSAVLLACCAPAAKLAAKIVEKKANTFTIGGAAFVGVLIAPWTLLLADRLTRSFTGIDLPVLPTLAVLAIAYAFGEGTGRLACISFGCCYGKPWPVGSRGTAKLFGTFAFAGKTKKAAYEGGLEGVPVIPIQAMTAVVLVGTGLIGTAIFLQGHAKTAFIVTWLLTQLWRAASESFRADFRGGGALSTYQILAVIGTLYGTAAAIFLPGDQVRPDLLAGLRVLWNPAVILSIQAAWIAIFLYTGRSKVTASTLNISVLRDRI